jgi:hypothetical protein
MSIKSLAGALALGCALVLAPMSASAAVAKKHTPATHVAKKHILAKKHVLAKKPAAHKAAKHVAAKKPAVKKSLAKKPAAKSTRLAKQGSKGWKHHPSV